MRNLKKLGAVIITVLAFTAISAATASAGTFEAEATGSFFNNANSAQEFDVNGGGNATNKVICNKATVNGTVNNLSSTELTMTVNYANCKAFFNILNVTVSAAQYLFTARDGGVSSNSATTVHIENTITINVGGNCNVVVGPQKVGSVQWNNAAGGDILASATAAGIVSNGNGGPCSTHSNLGVYVGNNQIGSASNLTYVKNP